jgi:hypothetical protein
VRYEPSDEHKNPWQSGRKGSPRPRDLDETARDALLAESVLHSGKRYATDETRAYEAQAHQAGAWHGYPVGWKEVPESLRRAWVDQGRVQRAAIKKHWERSS